MWIEGYRKFTWKKQTVDQIHTHCPGLRLAVRYPYHPGPEGLLRPSPEQLH